MPGSALLIGGEPGIGKSTLLLQLAATLARAGRRAVYFSGEEAAAQVRLRAARLGLSDAPVALACETSLAHILATLEAGPPPDLIVVDSCPVLPVVDALLVGQHVDAVIFSILQDVSRLPKVRLDTADAMAGPA